MSVDAGMADLAARMAAAQAEGPGLHLEVGAGLDVRLGRLISALEADQRRRAALSQMVAPVVLPPVSYAVVGGVPSPGTGRAGTGDQSPQEGFVWFVTRLTVAGLGSGDVVALHKPASGLITSLATPLHTFAAGSGATSTIQANPANPAAGADLTFTNTTGQPLTPQSVRFVFTTSAAVANRSLSVQYKDAAGNVIAQNSNLVSVTASSSLTTALAAGLPNIWNLGSGTALGGLPSGVSIPAGGSLLIHVASADVADQISGVSLVFTTSDPRSTDDWEPGGTGLCLHPDDSLLLTGAGLNAAQLVLSGEAIQVGLPVLADYLM